MYMLHVLVPLFLAWRDQRSRPPSAAGIALPVAQLHAIRYPNTLPRPPSSSLAVSRRLFAHCLDSGETPHARCTLPPLLSPTASQRLLPTAPPASPPASPPTWHAQLRTPNLINTRGRSSESRVSEGKRALTHSAARGQSPPRGPPRILRRRPPHLLEPTTPHLLGKLGVGPTSRRRPLSPSLPMP